MSVRGHTHGRWRAPVSVGRTRSRGRRGRSPWPSGSVLRRGGRSREQRNGASSRPGSAAAIAFGRAKTTLSTAFAPRDDWSREVSDRRSSPYPHGARRRIS